MLVRGRIYSPLSQPIAQPIQIWLLCYFANFGRLVSLLIIITQGVTHPSVTLLFLSPDVATTTRGTITLFAGYLRFELRTTRLTVESSTAELPRHFCTTERIRTSNSGFGDRHDTISPQTRMLSTRSESNQHR